MSRVGKKPIPVPDKASVVIDGQTVTIKGPKGEFVVNVLKDCTVEMTADGVLVMPVDQSKRSRSMWGLFRTLIANHIVGVTDGYEKQLDIQGIGYRAAAQGNVLNLALGLSHDVNFSVPQGIKVETPKPTEIIVSGADKQLVGQVAANIRKFREPEPFKGKGIRYRGEYVRRKEGKTK